MEKKEKYEVTRPGIHEQSSVYKPGRVMQSHWDSFLHHDPHDGQPVLLQALVIGVWEMGPWTLMSA